MIFIRKKMIEFIMRTKGDTLIVFYEPFLNREIIDCIYC